MTTLQAPTIELHAVLIELDPVQVAQHPDNLRDPSRDITALTASIAEVGVLVPLIVVPVELVTGHQFETGITHVAVDGNRRQAAARAAGLPLPCLVRPDLASARNAARTMAVTGLARDGLTPTEEAHAVAVLFDLKMSGAAIGRAIGRDKTHIAAARKAATLTPEAARMADTYSLTLVDMATIAEWQDTPRRGRNPDPSRRARTARPPGGGAVDRGEGTPGRRRVPGRAGHRRGDCPGRTGPWVRRRPGPEPHPDQSSRRADWAGPHNRGTRRLPRSRLLRRDRRSVGR